MGRKTWESLPEQIKPLQGRINAVISSNPDYELPEGVLQFDSLDQALMAISTSGIIDRVFVAGGGQLYAEAVLHPELEQIFLTRLEADFDCDVFFPEKIPEGFDIISATETMESDGLEYYMVILERTEEALLDADETVEELVDPEY
jgi:dihydrofolate reductase